MGLELGRVRAGAVASIGTHDTPTFAGWWRGEDVRGRLERGEIDGETAESELAGRASMRRRLAEGLGIDGASNTDRGASRRDADGGDETGESGERASREAADPDPHYESDYEVLAALLRGLGASRAGLVLATMEDLWLERAPQNVPGTPSRENWRRRLARPLEALAEPDVRALLETLNDARTESRQGGA